MFLKSHFIGLCWFTFTSVSSVEGHLQCRSLWMMQPQTGVDWLAARWMPCCFFLLFFLALIRPRTQSCASHYEQLCGSLTLRHAVLQGSPDTDTHTAKHTTAQATKGRLTYLGFSIKKQTNKHTKKKLDNWPTGAVPRPLTLTRNWTGCRNLQDIGSDGSWITSWTKKNYRQGQFIQWEQKLPRITWDQPLQSHCPLVSYWLSSHGDCLSFLAFTALCIIYGPSQHL